MIKVNIRHRVRYKKMITEIFKQDAHQLIEMSIEQKKQVLVQEEHVDWPNHFNVHDNMHPLVPYD